MAGNICSVENDPQWEGKCTCHARIKLTAIKTTLFQALMGLVDFLAKLLTRWTVSGGVSLFIHLKESASEHCT